jgi:hypothetical protein
MLSPAVSIWDFLSKSFANLGEHNYPRSTGIARIGKGGVRWIAACQGNPPVAAFYRRGGVRWPWRADMNAGNALCKPGASHGAGIYLLAASTGYGQVRFP